VRAPYELQWIESTLAASSGNRSGVRRSQWGVAHSSRKSKSSLPCVHVTVR
jgi:hypothetical protein